MGGLAVCRDIQARVVRGLFQLKLAANYALLDTVPFSISPSDLTGFNSYAILTSKQADIQAALMHGLQARHPRLLCSAHVLFVCTDDGKWDDGMMGPFLNQDS